MIHISIDRSDEMIADKLRFGDEIRVIAPSRSLEYVRKDILDNALTFLSDKGYKVTFSKNSREIDTINSSSILSRIEDLHEAFLDKNVKAVMACIGGFNVNQILEYIDYSIIENNPKILCGFSDITALLNAVYAKTGLVTYHGAMLCSFGFYDYLAYTNKMFEKCLLNNTAYQLIPSEQAGNYFVIQEGKCEGKIIGGNLCTLNLLQGTDFMPDLNDKILFIEDDNIMGDYFVQEFERNLQSLLQVNGANNIKGLVFGRFESNCKINVETVKRIVSTKKQLIGIPVVFNVDFGHVEPFVTFPIGARAKIIANDNIVSVEIVEH